MLLFAFFAAAAMFAVWRTAVVDWTVWYAPIAWLLDMFGLATAALFFFVVRRRELRRAALDTVGGFATGTATEDIHTSLRLHAAGWQSVFVPRPLAYGLEVDNLREHLNTRRRWAAGSLGLLFHSSDSPARIPGLTPDQRLSYLSSTLAHLQGLQRAGYLTIPILALLTLRSPIDTAIGGYGLALVALAGLGLCRTDRRPFTDVPPRSRISMRYALQPSAMARTCMCSRRPVC